MRTPTNVTCSSQADPVLLGDHDQRLVLPSCVL